MTDNSLKDRLLEAVDIVEVIGERVTLTKRGKEFIGLCPFHSDHKPSLYVNPVKRIFKCFACGVGGDVITFVQKIERLEFRDALAQLARRAGIALEPTSSADRAAAQRRGEMQRVVVWAREHYRRNLASPAGQSARDYAQRRGLSDATVERFGIGLAADAWDDLLSAARRAGIGPELLAEAGLITTNENNRTYDRFRNRLMFPIADTLGRPIAFGGRTLGDDPRKYLNSPETPLFPKSRILYGLDLARDATQKQRSVIVVEGYMDAVLLAQHGFEHVVATLGTALTDAHAKLLRPLVDSVVLCFDGDEAGVRAADRAVEVALRTQMNVQVVVLEGDKDPADCVTAGGAEAFSRQLTRARDALEFKWLQALSSFGRGDARARRAAVEQYVQFVAGVVVGGGVDPIQQDLLVGRLAEVLGVPAGEVFDLLSRAKRAQRRERSTAAPASGASAYDASVRGLPGGLVVAVETLLGLLVCDPRGWQSVDDSIARGPEYSETWRRFYRLLLDVHEDMGEYSIGDIVDRCDDSGLCELLDRARNRVDLQTLGPETFQAARERLAAELSVLERTLLQEEVRRSGGDDARQFELLSQRSRGRESVIPPEQQSRATAAAT